MKPTFVTPIAALVMLVAGVVPAAASGGSGGGGTGGGGTGGGNITIALIVSTPGQPGVDANDPNAPSPYRVVATPAPRDPTDPLAGICNPGNGPPPPWGYTWWVQVIDTATGAIVSETPQCVALPGAQPPPGPAPGVAQPPTIGAIWKSAALPVPTLGMSPPAEGITGLATWLWATSDAQLTIDVALGGYTVVGSARRVGFVFASGDGALLQTDEGGSRALPAVSHVYETKGTYRVVVGTVWSATVTMSGPGFSGRPTSIGEALVTASLDYPVVEVRGALTG